MRHQVFVPVPAERLRAALADPARVARAVPGLQQDAGAEPVAGRLKVRVGGHSVTYRGAVRVMARGDGAYAVEGDATEARGTGSVKLALTLRLAGAEGGSTVTVEGTADADGRITELPTEAVTSAATRLLNRFVESLAGVSEPPATATKPPPATGPEPEASPTAGPEPTPPAEPREAGSQPEPVAGTEAVAGPEPEPPPAESREAGPEPVAGPESEPPPAPGSRDAGAEPVDESREAGAGSEPPADPRTSVFDAEVPPPALDPEADDEAGYGMDPADRPGGGFTDGGEPPAEAAHARRTMIGRSAEEVDHAPPRGRYAPVPAPQTVGGNPALRWAAPAAALALASAIVVTRALRRRR
ncbi:SRPBCC family protein [Streptomyces sp. NPDC048514]|uniref:SRPBCC family protein n=1 Tax=Streptomyces sp. NPDC048514 TaxID=3365564 RepID=UPI00371E236B